MKMKPLFMVLCMLPAAAFGATERSPDSRVAVTTRMSMAGARGPNMVIKPDAKDTGTTPTKPSNPDGGTKPTEPKDETPTDPSKCRELYRSCMDEFCLLDESEGERCACSSNIEQSKSLIVDIQKIQADAEKLYTEGVEREKLGAKVNLVFGSSESAKKASRASGVSFTEWLNSGASALDEDTDIGDGLYALASEYCMASLESCGKSADMEEALYTRVIIQDCKNFSTYLTNQKKEAESNKKIAEAAVRQARLEMLDVTNKYNRGECLLAYKSCIADKGGCGANFENCLDAELLGRRANACENVLDQCMAVRTYVVEDWAAESKTVLADAAKYADRNRRATCFAKIQACLEDSCSTATNATCLNSISIASNICPIINECNEIVPGIRTSVAGDLGFLRTKFCQNDVDKCLQEKCGKNYTAPECVGKKASEIVALCPQEMFPSCKTETQFDIIVQSALLEMDYQMLQGCVNYFGTQLGNVCGTDMSCLPDNATVASLKILPADEKSLDALRTKVRGEATAEVDTFFKQFEKDITVAACKDAKKPAGRRSLGDSVFTTAKMIAYTGADQRAMRQLDAKLGELLRVQKTKNGEQACKTTYKVETPSKNSKNYSYIRSVSFEPAVCNCHVCRMQQVCEKGGESKGAAGAKGAAGGLAAGASAGTMIMPGWGTAIGAVVGGVGGLFAGRSAAGEQEFCQEIESCEDIAMPCQE